MLTPLTIDIQSLSFSYNANYKHYVFENVNLSVKEGEILLLQGSSGSGKSTLLKVIAGLAIKNSTITGDVVYKETSKFKEISIKDNSFTIDYRNKFVSLIFQNSISAFLDEMTVFDQLKPGLKNRLGLDDTVLYTDFSNYIQEFGFSAQDEVLKRRPNQLSGGQLQRLDIAYSLFTGSKVLLLDEPLTALDEDNYYLIIDKILAFSRGGGIVILASHDLKLEKILEARTYNLEEARLNTDLDRNNSLANLLKLNQSSKLLYLKASLSKTFSALPIFRNIEIELNDSISFLGITGESGAGKTSLLKILAGILPPDVGSKIEFSGTSKKIEMIFQASPQSLNPAYTLKNILQNTRLGGNQELVPLLHAFQLDRNLLERKPGQLSGGQIQRFCLLKALLNQPDLLLMDEPLVGLDDENKIKIIQTLQTIKENIKIKVIIVTHRVEEIQNLLDRVIKL